MKILYLLADFPYPLINGTRVQTFNLLRYMVRDHECHVLSFCDDDVHKWLQEFRCRVPDVHILGLFPRQSGLVLQIARVRHLLRGNPIFLARWENDAFARVVTQALRNMDYDLIHLEGIPMVLYLNLCKTKPTVVSTIDAVSLVYRRASDATENMLKRTYRRFASWSIGRFERKNLTKATKVHVVSKPDCKYLRNCIPDLDVEHIEIVVPEELINYPLPDSGSMEDESPRILFSGILSVDTMARGLLWFLSDVYPAILNACPDVQMVVLGRDAPPNVLKKIEFMPNVRYINWAEDYYGELAKSKIMVMPDLSGTGIKNRVLQAMALAIPIVGSPLVFEGIPIEDGVHCFERTESEGFAQAVINLLKDDGLGDRVGTSARQLVLGRYTMDVAGPRWLTLYNSAIVKFKVDDKYRGE